MKPWWLWVIQQSVLGFIWWRVFQHLRGRR